jgi:CheY-like chemotaxis protein
VTATILFVDDNEAFLEALQGAFDDFAERERYRLLVAHSVAGALDTLANARVDLVVTDLHMPEADGFDLIAHVSRHHPGLPILALTACADPSTVTLAQQTGALRVLQKPISVPELHARMTDALDARMAGRISGVTVASFLQLVRLDRKSCRLQITSGGRVGELVIAAGTILEARAGELSGPSAAAEIARWEPASIAITPGRVHAREGGSDSIERALLEAVRAEHDCARGKES